MKQYLAVDIGGTFIKFGLVDEAASILTMGKVKTPATLTGLIDFIVEKYHAYPDVAGLAISSPGAVAASGVIYGTSALPYLHGPNIKQMLADRIGIPVFMDNDGNCAGYAEVWKGKASDKQDVLVIVIGTGIGGAVIKDGRIHKGANLHGGEFGYMMIPTDAGYDTWSTTAATGALVKKVASLKGCSIHDLSGEYIFEMANAGDAICHQAVEEFFELLAIGIYNLQYMYDPEIILIGGGISAREDLIDHINRKLDELLARFEASHIKPNVEACAYRQHANILGAVYGFKLELETV